MSKKTSMTGIDRRGERVALLGFFVSLLGALLLGVLGSWSAGSSVSIWGAAFQMLGAAGVWVACYIKLHQHRLLLEERLDVSELERQREEKLGGVQTIFDEEDLDQMESLAMGRRMRSVERFLIPAIALVVALFHLLAGLSVLRWFFWQFPPIRDADSFDAVYHAQEILFFMGGMAFVAFMFSRYALGLTHVREDVGTGAAKADHAYGALRAGGNFMFGSSAICLAITLALLFEISEIRQVESWLGQAIGYLLIVFAVEAVANFILDFYRPRLPGQFQAPFYDSRLLGMFSEPGGILRSLANAIDYQFGFKVSETWFYKLLGRAVLPLILVEVVVILALTCIVVVPPGHQCVIERFGRPLEETAKPGMHLTWCWPIDRATIIPVERIQRMVLGHTQEVNDKEAQTEIMEDRLPILWTKQHYKKEYKLLVADRRASKDAKVPVNLLSLSMPVQWRVQHETDDDVIRYHAQAQNAKDIVESIAYRELTRYAASADITDLLGSGGTKAAGLLHDRIQKACNRAGYGGKGLGVEIVYVGIGGIHPPPDDKVAQSYEDVVSAIEAKDAAIKAAQGDAAKLRIESGGLVWKKLHDAIAAEDDARRTGAADVTKKTREVEQILRSEAGGLAREITATAEKRAFERIFSEKSASENYALQLRAYDAAPYIFKLRVYLRVIAESLKGVRKYVIVMDDPEKVLLEIDLAPPIAMDVLGAEVAAGEQRAEQR